MSRDTRLCSTTVPSQNGGPCSASAAPRITPMISVHSCAGGVVESVVPVLDQMAAQRRVQRLVHAVVMALGDTVFAVIAAQLSQEGHRLLGALVDELAEQPVSAWPNTLRWVPMSGGNRSRTAMSMANQRV